MAAQPSPMVEFSDWKASLASQTLRLGVVSLLSPAAGVAAEAAFAWRYGTTPMMDVFRGVYLLVSMTLSVLVMQILPNAVVPLMAKHEAAGREECGWRAALRLGGHLSIPVLGLLLASFLKPAGVLALLMPGVKGGDAEAGAVLLQACAVSLLLLVWGGVLGGVLNFYGAFAVVPIAQALGNGTLLISTVGLGSWPSHAAMSIGVLGGTVLMVTVEVIAAWRIANARRLSLYGMLSSNERLSRLEHLGSMLPLVSMAAATYWISMAANRALSRLQPGSVAEFGYAWKLLMLAGLLPAAFSTVVFPSLSRRGAQASKQELNRLAARSLRITLVLTLPVAACLFGLREDVAAVMFQRGAMTVTAIASISLLFGIVLIQAPAGGLQTLLLKVSLAGCDQLSPVLASFLGAVGAAVLMPWAAERNGAAGVAWAFVGLNWIMALTMLLRLESKSRFLQRTLAPLDLGRLAVLAGAAYVGSRLVARLRPQGEVWASGILSAAFVFLAGGAVLVASGWLGHAMGLPEFRAFAERTVGRFGRRPDRSDVHE